MPLRTTLPKVEIYVINTGEYDHEGLTHKGCDQLIAAYQTHLQNIHFGLAFVGPSTPQLQTIGLLYEAGQADHIPMALNVEQLDPFWVDQEDLPGITLENDLKTLRIRTSEQTLDSILGYSRRAMVLRGFFPEFLVRIAESETARSVRGRINYPILTISQSPLIEMAWPSSMVHHKLLRPADIICYTLEQTDRSNCRRWQILPEPEILSCPIMED